MNSFEMQQDSSLSPNLIDIKFQIFMHLNSNLLLLKISHFILVTERLSSAGIFRFSDLIETGLCPIAFEIIKI